VAELFAQLGGTSARQKTRKHVQEPEKKKCESMYKNQNRRQKVFNRGFAVLRVGLFFCLGGLDIIKLTKTPLIYSVSRFNLGSWALFRGAKPTKAPRGDGTDENNGYACSKMSKRFFQGRRKFLQGCEVLPLLTGLVNR